MTKKKLLNRIKMLEERVLYLESRPMIYPSYIPSTDPYYSHPWEGPWSSGSTTYQIGGGNLADKARQDG